MKVFAYRPTDRSVDCGAVVYDPDGNTLGAHVSSSLSWAQRDVQRFVPEGAEVVWCIGRAQLQAQIDAGELRGLTFDEPA